MRDLLIQEARIHALPRREVRDLGDSILLLDRTDPEPFWNRLAAVRWPEEPDAFDRRLTEVLLIFAAAARQPHVWPAPVHDQPADLVERLKANGFRDTGPGIMMIRRPDPDGLPPDEPPADDVTLHRLAGLDRAAATAVAQDIVDVLADAFDMAPEREAGIREDTIVGLGHPWFAYFVARVRGRAAAVARAATFDGLTYLTSIGTASWARGRGLGRLVTATAVREGVAARSRLIHLGVFADNPPAIRLYQGLGFQQLGQPCPDLLLV